MSLNTAWTDGTFHSERKDASEVRANLIFQVPDLQANARSCEFSHIFSTVPLMLMLGGDVNFLEVLTMCLLLSIPTEATIQSYFWSSLGYLCFITVPCLDCEVLGSEDYVRAFMCLHGSTVIRFLLQARVKKNWWWLWAVILMFTLNANRRITRLFYFLLMNNTYCGGRLEVCSSESQ